MKIVCESCQAKYSIADEKVAGKVFKIRCKRCSEVILVRGDQQSPKEQVAQAAVLGGRDAIWHVVIEGEQRGPYAPEQIGELLSNGQIDWEAYVWREGLDNWIPACDIQELVDAIMGTAGTAQQAAAPAADPFSQSVDAVPSPGAAARAMAAAPINVPSGMGADPFADDGGGRGGDLFGAGASAAAGADLFGGGGGTGGPFGGAANPFEEEGATTTAYDGLPAAAAASPRVDMAQAMTGARNENSVLFSLKNLQALATGSSATPITPSGAPPGMGFASGEGSGLIDIRALASATGLGKDLLHEEDRDELLSIGSKTGAFGSLGSPMVAPAAMADEEGSKRKLVFAILAGSVFLGLCLIAVAMILRPTVQPQQVAAAAVAPAVAPAPVKSALAAAAPVAPPAAAAEPLSEGEKAARAAMEAEAAKKGGSSGDRESRRGGGSHRKPGKGDETVSPGTSASKSASSEAPAAAPEPAAPVKKKSTGNESIDDLLNNALSASSGPKPAKKAETAAGPGEPGLPEKPSRDEVMSALRGVQPAASACGQGSGGVAMANIVVGSSGRVQSVEVTGVPGAVASCVSRAVRGAHFPKFSAPKFSVSFPFRL